MIELAFKDKDKELKFSLERLKPFEQFNFILKIVSIISKGAKPSDTARVEQILHDVLQTGKQVDEAKPMKDEVPITLLLDAVKGALGSLEEKDRDWLIKELLKNVKIHNGPVIEDATIDLLNHRLSGFQPVFKLLIELVKVNLGFL